MERLSNMVESFVMIQEDYKRIYQLWAEIAESGAHKIKTVGLCL